MMSFCIIFYYLFQKNVPSIWKDKFFPSKIGQICYREYCRKYVCLYGIIASEDSLREESTQLSEIEDELVVHDLIIWYIIDSEFLMELSQKSTV